MAERSRNYSQFVNSTNNTHPKEFSNSSLIFKDYIEELQEILFQILIFTAVFIKI